LRGEGGTSQGGKKEEFLKEYVSCSDATMRQIAIDEDRLHEKKGPGVGAGKESTKENGGEERENPIGDKGNGKDKEDLTWPRWSKR